MPILIILLLVQSVGEVIIQKELFKPLLIIIFFTNMVKVLNVSLAINLIYDLILKNDELEKVIENVKGKK